MFQTLQNATHRAISAPFKNSVQFMNEQNLLAHKHTTELCELMSNYWVAEHEITKRELATQMTKWNNYIQTQVDEHLADSSTTSVHIDIAGLQKGALQHRKELQKNRKLKVTRNISQGDIFQSTTSCQNMTEADCSSNHSNANVQQNVTRECTNVTTEAIIHHNPLPIHNLKRTVEPGITTRNTSSKYAKLSLKKRQTVDKNIRDITLTRETTNERTNEYLKTPIESTINTNLWLKDTPHIPTPTNKSRLGKHKIYPNENSVNRTSETQVKHPENKLTSKNTPTVVNNLKQPILESDTHEQDDSIRLSCETNNIATQSMAAHEHMDVNTDNMLDITAQEYDKCIGPWMSQHICTSHSNKRNTNPEVNKQTDNNSLPSSIKKNTETVKQNHTQNTQPQKQSDTNERSVNNMIFDEESIKKAIEKITEERSK
jgi:hypothetical protein